ncbi:translation initiation factor IF-1 [Candidatus Deianiraea vastatrix]|uniref:Translation initiation factor IF-1 n=1 Tax=Candidatus Deianiraea vastatrix TaxID=2163644 RepID=A0A5B8XE76_9RICK|nr:translation initiation factor IF-1 [Candidatus Deianiraea vastatrix]QED23649.1 Translation initiation factor IF-1 [Candidatus Deianiraea vastatrix]
MSKDDIIEMDGVILKCQPGAIFLVKLENGVEILCHVSGNVRRNKIKIVIGDKVKVELSVYDLTKGRISYRY